MRIAQSVTERLLALDWGLLVTTFVFKPRNSLNLPDRPIWLPLRVKKSPCYPGRELSRQVFDKAGFLDIDPGRIEDFSLCSPCQAGRQGSRRRVASEV